MGRDQELHRVCVAPISRDRQDGFQVAFVLGGQVGLVNQQQLHDFQVAAKDCQMQRRPPTGLLGVDGGAVGSGGGFDLIKLAGLMTDAIQPTVCDPPDNRGEKRGQIGLSFSQGSIRLREAGVVKMHPIHNLRPSKKWILRRLMGWLWLASIPAVQFCFSQTKPEVKAVVGHLKPGDTPYPTAAAPNEMRSVIRDGAVTLVFSSDPEFLQVNVGRADYFLRWAYNYGFTCSKSKKNGRWEVKVTANNIEPSIRLEHVIRLPMKYRAELDWNGRLLRHELDHVAISLDARPKLLLVYLCRNLPTMERTLAAGEEPSDALCRRIINEEIDRRLKTVDELIGANYVLLDQVSKHGTIPIPSRAEFFGKLFTKQHLAQQKFPFLTEVRELLASPAYQQVKLRFLPRDPTER